jgi:cytochrome c-type protein NapB
VLTRRVVAISALALIVGCGDNDAVLDKNDAKVVRPDASAHSLARAARRAYDGAPPVIPHQNYGMNCVNCHKQEGLKVPGIGFAPAMPHARTAGMKGTHVCTQCHVWKKTDEEFVGSNFVGLRQNLRHGKRGLLTSPPVMPHSVQMRENCLACHSGPAAREEIRCSHPERVNCRQCHVSKTTTTEFPPG